ncbi:threonine synthase [Friedmanniella endophytica]|uniref:Threonine synthase n=1 Tax=Microlunatus kandeliicorticis TaxID=1759536 RepID=A0A7W3P481_9ACTN|nr:threonine synthase [Microlunatus kandeliicorticis]MBA8792629.1 threonine synthase [Microlunatus kandeliicorticis]
MNDFSALSHLECSRTGTRQDADVVAGLSPTGAPLLVRYDLDHVRATVDRDALAARPADLWRYHEVLPVRGPAHVTTLGEGWTPLLPAARYGAAISVPGLMIKDEGALPTASFKARGAAVGVSRARELGVGGIAMPSNGNAGAAWALYAARAGLASMIMMPVGAPDVCRREAVAAGADVVLVDGLINDAGRLVRERMAAEPERFAGWQDVSTLREPYRIEGKKTMGYEIAEQLGWRLPEVIVYPAGGGVGLIGIHKALQELVMLGWVEGPLPRLVAVQAAGCAPIVAAYEAGLDHAEPVEVTPSVAFGINVPTALGDRLMLTAVRETGGTAVAVGDADLLAEERAVTAAEGLFVCPEGGACLAAVRRLRADGWLDGSERVVVLNTGSGLIYPETVDYRLPLVDRDGRPAGEGSSASAGSASMGR